MSKVETEFGEVFVCKYCGEDTGKFNEETGDHPQCTELAALRERVGKLEEEKERTRETVKMARQKLQSTQINWQEDCLFQCNDLLGIALDVCPSCIWRGDVSLQDGTCPYCQVNWHALRGEA